MINTVGFQVHFSPNKFIAKITEVNDEEYKVFIDIDGNEEFRSIDNNGIYSEVHPSCLSNSFIYNSS